MKSWYFNLGCDKTIGSKLFQFSVTGEFCGTCMQDWKLTSHTSHPYYFLSPPEIDIMLNKNEVFLPLSPLDV